ncbi:hypothetical protein AB0C34_04285 [Nocardia sp. NPDC049220]|uniref:hypothetical protein n=1 Tax=Nocardia sp. NPDC049220 TaxID=3155273 RepID=UPI0033CCA913
MRGRFGDPLGEFDRIAVGQQAEFGDAEDTALFGTRQECVETIKDRVGVEGHLLDRIIVAACGIAVCAGRRACG